MKKIAFMLSIAASFFFFPSCTKTNNVIKTIYDTTTVITRDTIVKKDTVYITPSKYPIVGSWIGTYLINNPAPGYNGAYYCAFDIFADGTIIQRGGGATSGTATGNGTWTLSTDSVLTTTIDNTDQNQGSLPSRWTAHYSSVNGTLNGSWLYVSGSSTTGTFSLKRVQ